MSRKKILAIAAAAVIILATAAAWILWPSHPYIYRIRITDAAGQEIENLGQLKPGAIVEVSTEVRKKGKDTSIDFYGLELTMTVKGLTYNGDGIGFAGADVAGKVQALAETETVSFMYMNLNREEIKLENPLASGRCTFTVTDPEQVAVSMTTALVYTAEHTQGYEMIQGK